MQCLLFVFCANLGVDPLKATENHNVSCGFSHEWKISIERFSLYEVCFRSDLLFQKGLILTYLTFFGRIAQHDMHY